MSKTFLLCLMILSCIAAFPFVRNMSAFDWGFIVGSGAVYLGAAAALILAVFVIRGLWRAARRVNFKTTRDA